MSDFNMKREDYEEPVCPLISPQTGERLCSNALPMQRIVEKFEEYCNLKDFTGAERHLKYWLGEAEATGDVRGQFSLRNEMMGFYRKQGEYEKTIESINEALRLMGMLDNEESISGATCHINCGTAHDTFGEAEQALSHFRKAEEILGRAEYRDLYKLGSLYNNMALALTDLDRFDEAMEYYAKALDTMRSDKDTELEQAITYLNMADCLALKQGLAASQEKIDEYMNAAMELIDTESLPHDGYYAFVCEKCAPGFNCYGFFDFAEDIEKRAADIYAGLADEGK